MYAKVDPMTGLDEEGVGNGFVRRFNANGVRDLTFGINNGALNSPWGIALAPATFGIFGGALLDWQLRRRQSEHPRLQPDNRRFPRHAAGRSGNGIVIDELWALKFGNGGAGGDVNTLYFTAGIGRRRARTVRQAEANDGFGHLADSVTTDEFVISEGTGHIDITVTRAGDASGAATVNFNTFDESQPGHASQKI